MFVYVAGSSDGTGLVLNNSQYCFRLLSAGVTGPHFPCPLVTPVTPPCPHLCPLLEGGDMVAVASQDFRHTREECDPCHRLTLLTHLKNAPFGGREMAQ